MYFDFAVLSEERVDFSISPLACFDSYKNITEEIRVLVFFSKARDKFNDRATRQTSLIADRVRALQTEHKTNLMK